MPVEMTAETTQVQVVDREILERLGRMEDLNPSYTLEVRERIEKGQVPCD